jgi:hypothetical protein
MCFLKFSKLFVQLWKSQPVVTWFMLLYLAKCCLKKCSNITHLSPNLRWNPKAIGFGSWFSHTAWNYRSIATSEKTKLAKSMSKIALLPQTWYFCCLIQSISPHVPRPGRHIGAPSRRDGATLGGVARVAQPPKRDTNDRENIMKLSSGKLTYSTHGKSPCY